MRTDVETLIIGAGPAGLAVGRCLSEAGQTATLVERQRVVGSMWRCAYERLHLHTPRSRSALPFMPMPASYPRYPSRQQVVDYLDSYAAAIGQPILFGQIASRVTRDGERWITTVGDDSFTSRNLVVAISKNRVPALPQVEGLDLFAGPALHSSAYTSGAAFRGQRVLVVGFGNSAAEIALDLAEQGALPTVSVRGGVNVIPREIFGVPSVNLGVVQRLFSARMADAINAPVIRLHVGDITRLGLRKLPYGPTVQVREHRQIPVIDVGTLALIRAGAITVRPGIARFDARGAVFADGREERFDAVVFGTGFQPGLADLLTGIPGILEADGSPRVSGDRTAASGLYFCGYRIVSSGALREIGIEARAIAGLIASGQGARPAPAKVAEVLDNP